MEELLKEILKRLDKIEANQDKLAIEIGHVHDRLKTVEVRMAATKTHLDALMIQGENTSAKLVQFIGKIENRDSDTNARFVKLEKAIAALQEQIGKKAVKPRRRAK